MDYGGAGHCSGAYAVANYRKKVNRKYYRMGWSQEAARALKSSMLGDDAQIEKEVRAGRLALLLWGRTVLTVVERHGAELVICCAVGKGIAPYFSDFIELARRNRCSSIRFHSQRPGLARMAAKFKPVVIGHDHHGQTIYRVAV